MSDSQQDDQIAAAMAYDALFLPALNQQWTPLVAEIAAIQPGSHVLDIACGTGVLTLEAAKRAGSAGRIVGVDLSPGMLAVARDKSSTIEWKQGSAEALPFPDGSFDAVVSQFGLMFFPDQQKSLQEMLRVLAPGGRLAVVVWDSLDNIPAYADEVALLQRMAGTKAADALRAPFNLGDKEVLLNLAQGAGITSAEVTTHKGTARFPSIRTLVEADLRGWLPVMGVHLTEAKNQEILTEAEIALSAYVNEQNQAEFPVSALILSGSSGR